MVMDLGRREVVQVPVPRKIHGGFAAAKEADGHWIGRGPPGATGEDAILLHLDENLERSDKPPGV